MRCTLRQLQVFAAVARHASYTRAAEELHLTQPAVFTQVKQLEDALGAVLLDRIGKRLFLTEAGQAVLATARETLEGIERLEMQLADLQGLRRGRLRLAIVSTAQYFLPRLLGAFCTENPGIEVALTVTNRQTVIARLAANEDDLCILGQPPEGLDVVARPIARNAILVLAPPGHPLAGVTAVPFAALAEAPFILREPGSGTRAAAEKFFAENGIRPQVRMELGSNEAIKAAVAAGLGLAILSQDTITLEAETGRLAVLDVQGFPLLRVWNVAYPRGKHLSVAARAFLAHLAAGSAGPS
ncbi:LysR family transcriptional regulator [Rhodobacter capsulatus]|jgi:DNA-binding transcriptional LysR family regulator|uniref:HTH-type transcriptional regulator CbbR n=2 Tax=Rhodobacter capsulatus TaxID=1061 RepID=D5ANJ1_RHOCB|nr:LysR family transcriptional regulator [Rhodobacter capsulatus]AAC32308.1 CbbRI [Rhodobacter capsulatus SB 1003]ADE84345.1 RuBisCO operon transcriptional regulator CbbR-1 [Rhodobacter capsulatus SB 1003]ETD02662.1 LysR family transcriptional regulator [Rhodobacter capsulatus DE442]ETD78818.1 LysR family transcriptional regulator [Rhodobacter capsulatus R121]ETE54797.1 LysR family transcriptional regulator [Rhodobacter capsulatus Y262]